MLIWTLRLIKISDLDKYKYTGYGIGFDSGAEFLFTDRNFEKNVIIFGADMSSYVHVDNKGKDILILGEGPTQGLDDTTLTVEAINFITVFYHLSQFYHLSILRNQEKDLY